MCIVTIDDFLALAHDPEVLQLFDEDDELREQYMAGAKRLLGMIKQQLDGPRRLYATDDEQVAYDHNS